MPAHFLTATVNHCLPPFIRPETVNIVLDAWRFLQREAGLVIYGYVILENHLHLVELDYIHHNPVKRCYVDQPELWRYSSARNYAGQEGVI